MRTACGGLFVLGAVALLATSEPAAGADFFVSPTGTSSQAPGAGSAGTPWDLETALSHPAAVQPGDTIWLLGGTYVGRFESVLSGTLEKPIVVRAMPGERARLDGGPGPLGATLTIGGRYVWYWGFEVFSSSTTRTSTQDGSSPTDLDRGACIGGAQDEPHPGVRLVNLVLHDGTDAVGFFEAQEDAEIYGNLIYNNGWDGATDRGHGNGMYLQNRTGTKRVENNIVFGQFEGGLQIYGSDAAYLDNIQVVGNTVYESGAPSRFGRSRNILFGGGRIAHDGSLEANVSYHVEPGGAAVSAGVQIGYVAGISRFAVRDNWFSASEGLLSCDFDGPIDALTMTGNGFLGAVGGIDTSAFPDNLYLGAARPTGVTVLVRPNAYEPGRANVTVLNWDLRAFVDVDLGGALAVGTPFEIRNAQDFFGAAVLAGVYGGGTVRLPMTGLTAVAPIGSPRPAQPTGPEFNVFVVLPTRPPCPLAHCSAAPSTGRSSVVRRPAR